MGRGEVKMPSTETATMVMLLYSKRGEAVMTLGCWWESGEVAMLWNVPWATRVLVEDWMSGSGRTPRVWVRGPGTVIGEIWTENTCEGQHRGSGVLFLPCEV